ncbi:hypothetical protein CAEBREN_13243 [Caenorhabditis brenneri]|uniref:Uncharacterized protein n=1 Tax=Caenorhabditis brenneri TaxID=135651 RepID=G0MRM0_CAEBE|nr:hypothetical protein CAEBREN_13243 [Caenorhabditis brenneri]
MVFVKIWIVTRPFEQWKSDRFSLIFGYSGALIINLFFHFYFWWTEYKSTKIYFILTIYHLLIITHSVLFIMKPAERYIYNYKNGETAFTFLSLLLFPLVAIPIFGTFESYMVHIWLNFLFSFYVIELKVVLNQRYSSLDELPFSHISE